MLPVALKRRVLELLDSVQPESRYKVLIIDRRTKQLLDLVVDKAELLNRQVANVLLLDEPRQTEGYLEAVYIVEQCAYSFGCIQADFVRAPRRYAAAHIFLLPRMKASAAAQQRFENSSIAPFIKRIELAPLALLALEQRIFSLGLPHANLVLYNQACKDMTLELVDLTGRQLASLCEMLRVAPYVRFSARWQVTRANAFPALVARAAAQHIETARQRYMTPALDAEPRPTLVVLDRTVDISAPLRHEFGLQAMALDVLDTQFAPRDTLRTFTASGAGSEPQTLSERETAWVDLRHKHIVVVTEELNTRIRELRTANPHLADPSSDVSVGDVRNMLAALPEFMKERESVALTLDMALECMAAVEKLHLKEVAEFEQSVTLGTTPDGAVRPEVRLADALVTILATKSVDRPMKIRALALYALYRGGLRRADYDRLQRHAHLAEEDIAVVEALSYLGAPLTYLGPSAAKLPEPLTREHKQQPLLYARVQTGLQTVIEQYTTGLLDSAAYPYVGEQPDSTQEALTTATSLRNPRQRATWAQNVAPAAASADLDIGGGSGGGSGGGGSASEGGNAGRSGSFAAAQNKRLLLLFVIGGFTASEAQAAYDISERTAFSVVLGGHDMLTPSKFLDFLRNIKASREDLHLPEDEPDPAVPEFLFASDRQNRQQQPPASSSSSSSKQNTSASYQQQQQQQRYPQSQSPKKGQSPVPFVGQSKKSSGGGSSTSTSAARAGPAAHITPTTYLSAPVNQTLGDASAQMTNTSTHKEKKDMKHRLKGAFKLKK